MFGSLLESVWGEGKFLLLLLIMWNWCICSSVDILVLLASDYLGMSQDVRRIREL